MEPRGSAALSDTPYTLFASSSDGRRAGSWPYLCTLLAVLLGTGVHASKEALVPSEKSLEALGLSPVCYSALTITPVALGIVTPLAWGRLWDTRAALVLVGAPLGELVGSGLTACGLLALGARNSPAAAAAILAGLVASSACRAGITIAEFSLVGRVCGRNAAAGFGALVVAKHGMGSLMSWAVPILLGEGALRAPDCHSPRECPDTSSRVTVAWYCDCWWWCEGRGVSGGVCGGVCGGGGGVRGGA